MPLKPCPWPIADLLPHAAPMLLLDRAEAYSPETAVAVSEIRSDHPLMTDDGVPAHVGIELMAQTCGAHVGALALAEGKPVKLGFLLGSRDFRCTAEWFRIGDVLRIEVSVVLMEGGMGVYDCRIDRGGEAVATARLNLYQPENAEAALP
jgi:predicted hotdog family 3-hydroxylacyl-ACP dehydratase